MAHPLSDPEIEITPDQAAKALQDGEASVIDVREPYERDAGHIDGTRHIELERLASKADTIDRDKPVIFVCRLGTRSLMAAQAFRRAGYDAYSMAGGITAWHEQNLPLTPDGGHVAPH
jgi:hydroxyacylglutathione hydrolase/adenylyltransferase/sulfurtransferase